MEYAQNQFYALDNEGQRTSARPELSVTLDVVEPMGNEIIIYVNTKAHRLVARLIPQSLAAPGSQILLGMDSDKLHFFDAESEKAIT